MAQIHNHDLAGYIARLDKFAFELHKSASSGVTEMNVYDQERLQSYLDALVTLKGHHEAMPRLDQPESHGVFMFDVKEAVEYELVENESINDLLRLFKMIRFEMVNSQSSRLGSGWISHDSLRVDSYVQKCMDYLASYVQIATPLDQPESAPNAAMSGAGRLGV